jgi:acetylglutamate kinase
METVLVKIGGKAAEDTGRLAGLCGELRDASPRRRFLLVHGGGAEVTAMSRRLGIEAVFRDGIRQTSPQEMDIVEMVLAGRMNKAIVRLGRACGLNAVGLSGSDGGLFIGRAAGGDAETRTGEISAVDRRVLDLLLDSGFLPVIAPTSMDREGRGLNINADAVAFGLARELAAAALLFLSDIPGVLRDKEVIPELSAREAGELIASGGISGGMVPKVRASLDALSHGVGTVIIGGYECPGDLARLLEGSAGTRIRS